MALTATYEPWSSNIGVGTNEPTYPTGSTLDTSALRQTVGNAVDWVGGKLGIPETGISEAIAGGPTTNTGAVYAADTGQDLVAALISKGGYNYTDAVNAANGPNASNLRNEFLGGGGGDTSSAAQLPYTPPTQTYNISGTPVTSLATPQGAEQAIKSIYGDTDYGNYQEQFNFDPSQFLNQIDQDAASQMAFLDKSQSALDEAKAAFQQLIDADYANNLSKGQGAKESSLQQLEANKVKAQQLRQDALNAAKQLYNQLSMGYQQRFGGASGASEASRAILGQEQQRQGAQINRDYMNTVNSVQAQKAETEKQYAQMVQDLDYQKQRAQYDALQTYQTNMRAIDADRTQTESAKNQAKMQVLMQLRDNQNAVAAADRQYRQQLDAMKAQTQMQLDASLLQMQQQAKLNASTGAGTVGGFADKYSTVSSNLGQNQTTRTAPVLSSAESAVGFTSPWGYEDKDRQQSVMY